MRLNILFTLRYQERDWLIFYKSGSLGSFTQGQDGYSCHENLKSLYFKMDRLILWCSLLLSLSPTKKLGTRKPLLLRVILSHTLKGAVWKYNENASCLDAKGSESLDIQGFACKSCWCPPWALRPYSSSLVLICGSNRGSCSKVCEWLLP